MAQMYFYKFNINSEIYDVYRDEELQNRILQNVFKAITQDISYKNDYKDADGVERIIEYKFCDLEKDIDKLMITGRLVKIYDGESQKYDRDRDTVETRFEEDKAASATFCFDLRNEEIAFITRIGLGYIQFGEYFKNLLELSFPEDSFELILEKNVGLLRDKVYAVERILKMKSTIIPPNANEKEFALLLGATVDEFKDTEATKYTQIIEVPAKSKKKINAKTKFFDRLFYAIGKGYADMWLEGKDGQNNKVIIESNEDAPYHQPIPEKEKDSILAFKERSEIEITKLLRDKTLLKVNDDDEDDEDDEENGGTDQD